MQQHRADLKLSRTLLSFKLELSETNAIENPIYEGGASEEEREHNSSNPLQRPRTFLPHSAAILILLLPVFSDIIDQWTAYNQGDGYNINYFLLS